MSKKNLENLSGIGKRIVKVLIDKGMVKRDGSPNFSKAERECGMKGTILQKAVKRNGGLYDDNLDKFLGTFHVSRDWFLYERGDPYVKNGTSVSKPATLDARVSRLQDDKIKLMEELMAEKDARIGELQQRLAECLRSSGKK